MSNPLDTQVDGSHYKDLKIQPVEFIHANGIGFMEGAVIKYVARHKAKNGARDLRKAIHFLELLLKLEYDDAELPPAPKAESVGPEGVAEALNEPRFKYRGGITNYKHHCCNMVWFSSVEIQECPACKTHNAGKWNG